MIAIIIILLRLIYLVWIISEINIFLFHVCFILFYHVLFYFTFADVCKRLQTCSLQWTLDSWKRTISPTGIRSNQQSIRQAGRTRSTHKQPTPLINSMLRTHANVSACVGRTSQPPTPIMETFCARLMLTHLYKLLTGDTDAASVQALEILNRPLQIIITNTQINKKWYMYSCKKVF